VTKARCLMWRSAISRRGIRSRHCRWLSISVTAALLCPLDSAIGHAQETRYRGTVTNHGMASSPTKGGISATLEVRGQPRSSAELIVGPGLGGSGSVRGAQLGRTVLLTSISNTGDTIAWIGIESDRGRLSGEYLIIGGPYEGQGGRWNLAHDAGSGFLQMPAAASSKIRDLTEATARLRSENLADPGTTPATEVPGSDAPFRPVLVATIACFVTWLLLAGGGLLLVFRSDGSGFRGTTSHIGQLVLVTVGAVLLQTAALLTTGVFVLLVSSYINNASCAADRSLCQVGMYGLSAVGGLVSLGGIVAIVGMWWQWFDFRRRVDLVAKARMITTTDDEAKSLLNDWLK